MRYLFLLTALFCSLVTQAQDFPEPSKHLVTDYAQVLSAEDISRLEQKLLAYEDSTSTQVAIVLLPSTGNYEAADYAVRLAEKWGIGTKEKNNGLIILAAIEDRKVTIQTGYGMEGPVPDAICKRIIENEIKPNFKQGDYYAGLDAATTAIIQYSKGEYKSEGKKGKKKNIPYVLIIFGVIALLAFLSKRGGGGTRINGGGGNIPFWMLMNSGGSGRGSFGDFSSGGGSFGGFGGGSFGGGGASGSW